MFSNEKYKMKKGLYFTLGIVAFSLLITLFAFEYGVATLIVLIATCCYYLVFEKSINYLLENSHSKAAVISIYIASFFRYIIIGGGLVAIFFLFSQFSVRIYAVIIMVMAWFLCIWMRNRR